MDTPTQALLGAVTAHLGFRQRLGGAAPWVAAFAASIADADTSVVGWLGLDNGPEGAMAYFIYHRGLSHSLLAAPVIAAVIAGVWWLVRRWRGSRAADRRAGPFALLFACCLAGALSHVLLDWCTSYGTQLLSPLTDTRYALDAIGIIDLIYTSILIATLVVVARSRRRARRTGRPDRTARVATVGLVLSIAYIAAGYQMRLLAEHYAKDLAASPNPAAPAVGEIRAYPRIGTIFVWRVTRRETGGWTSGRINVLFGRQPGRWDSEHVASQDNRWIRQALALPQAQKYDWFARGQTRAAYRREDDRHVVELHDMRYGWPAESTSSMWPMVFTFNEEGNLVSADHRRHFERRGPRIADIFKRFWQQQWKP